MVWWPALAELFEPERGLVDVIEVEPQVFWRAPRDWASAAAGLAALTRLAQPKLLHSALAPVGGLHVSSAGLAALADAVEIIRPQWVSEHCSFSHGVTRSGEVTYANFLLPPAQTEAGAAVVAANLVRLKGLLGLPVLFETGVNYLKPRRGDLPDGRFWAEIAEQADCGILLDLHNLWANAHNGRESVEETLASLPLNRVVEIHMAGGVAKRGYWIDAHSGPSPEPLKALLHTWLPQMPNLRALIFEIMPEHVSSHGLEPVARELEDLQDLWAHRNASAAPASPALTIMPPTAPAAAEASVSDWEADLLEAITWPRSDRDAGFAVIAAEIADFRAGALARNLHLALRLLHLRLGERATREMLEAFWRASPSEVFPAAEALNAADFLRRRAPTVQGLAEVLAFHCAVIHAKLDRVDTSVPFSFEPLAFLEDLRAGNPPRPLRPGDFVLEVCADDWD